MVWNRITLAAALLAGVSLALALVFERGVFVYVCLYAGAVAAFMAFAKFVMPPTHRYVLTIWLDRTT